MVRTSSKLMLVGILLALVIAAPAHGAATRAEYVAQAEPHCAAANSDIDRLNARYARLFAAERYFAAGGILEKTGRRLSRSVAQVRAITPPPGDEGTIGSWLDLVQQVAKNNVLRGQAVAREHFKVAVHLAAKRKRISARAHGLVAGFGFHACVGEP